MSKRVTRDEFIQRSMAIHGNRYGYDSVEYVDTRTKVAIICPKHGIFIQSPDKHMAGRGCPKCKAENLSKRKTIPFETFLIRSRQAHGWKYEYDESSYSSIKNKTRIICPIHGEFWENAEEHVEGHGCMRCYREQRCGKSRQYSKEKYVEKANIVHNGKYDYSNAKYAKARDIIDIICPTHGQFKQLAYLHLQGRGCPYCGGTKKHTNDTFIEKARDVHGDTYDYSLVEYISNKTKVAIICKTHGIFYQTPNDHLCGKGCPYCQETVGERKIRRILESSNIEFEQEKRFSDCRKTRTLSFDFYLPKRNICIEFQGKQHYESIEVFDNGDSLEERKLRDQIKRDYCASHGIKLIEIRYDQDIEQELNKHLQLCTTIL